MSQALGGLGVLAIASRCSAAMLVQAWHWRATLAQWRCSGSRRWPSRHCATGRTLPRLTTRPDRAIAATWRHRRPSDFRRVVRAAVRLLGGLFALLSSSSFVFIELFGTGRAVFGALLASCSVSTSRARWCAAGCWHGNAARAVPRRPVSAWPAARCWPRSRSSARRRWHRDAGARWLYGAGHGINQPCATAGVTSARSRARARGGSCRASR